MSHSPLLGTVAAVGLASNDSRSQHSLGQVVGRLEVLDVEETQEVRPVLAQASGKAGIVRIGEAPRGCDQGIQAVFEILARSVRNPFDLPELSEFRCPVALWTAS